MRWPGRSTNRGSWIPWRLRPPSRVLDRSARDGGPGGAGRRMVDRTAWPAHRSGRARAPSRDARDRAAGGLCRCAAPRRAGHVGEQPDRRSAQPDVPAAGAPADDHRSAVRAVPGRPARGLHRAVRRPVPEPAAARRDHLRPEPRRGHGPGARRDGRHPRALPVHLLHPPRLLPGRRDRRRPDERDRHRQRPGPGRPGPGLGPHRGRAPPAGRGPVARPEPGQRPGDGDLPAAGHRVHTADRRRHHDRRPAGRVRGARGPHRPDLRLPRPHL